MSNLGGFQEGSDGHYIFSISQSYQPAERFRDFTRRVIRTPNGMLRFIYDVLPILDGEERGVASKFASDHYVSTTTDCSHCGQPVLRENADILAAYWTHSDLGPFWQVVHKECKILGRNEEALACQRLDADCNDCKHFQRGVNVAPEWAWRDHPGWCAKLSKPVAAQPNFASLLPCFEHRKDVR